MSQETCFSTYPYTLTFPTPRAADNPWHWFNKVKAERQGARGVHSPLHTHERTQMLPPLQGLSINPVAVPTDAGKRPRDDDELDIKHTVCANVKLSRCAHRGRLDAVESLFRNTDPNLLEKNVAREKCMNIRQTYNVLKPVGIFDIVYESGGAMYDNYIEARDNMSVSDNCTKYGPFLECVRTDKIEGLQDRTGIGPLRSWINEKYLVHGLNLEVIEDVLKSSCDPHYTTGSMYGPTRSFFYQAEDVGKADQYCLTSKIGHSYHGADMTLNRKLGVDVSGEELKRTYYMFITRTLLGCANHTPRHTHGDGHAANKDLEGHDLYRTHAGAHTFVEPFDSLIVEHGRELRGGYNSGNIGSLVSGYREFLVSAKEQVLPVMLVAYVRVDQTPAPAFDYKRLECFYPIEPAIPMLMEELRSFDPEERAEAEAGLRKLVPALFAQLRREQHVVLNDSQVSSTGKEVRVTNAGLVKLLPSLVPLLNNEGATLDSSWWKTAFDLLQEKYITPFLATSMSRAVMIQLLVEQKVIPALMHSIDARQPSDYGDQLRVLSTMIFPRELPGDRASDNGAENRARKQVVQDTYENISYAMREMGYTAKLVNLFNSPVGGAHSPQLKIAGILRDLVNAAHGRGDVVDVVRGANGATIATLVQALGTAPAVPNEAYPGTSLDWVETRKRVCVLLNVLVNGPTMQDALYNAGGIAILVKELQGLLGVPRRASQKQYERDPSSKDLLLTPAYPAISAIFEVLDNAILGREQYASALLHVPELEATLSQLKGWTNLVAKLAFPPISLWDACATALNFVYPGGRRDNERVRNSLVVLHVFPPRNDPGAAGENAATALVDQLRSPNAKVTRLAKEAVSSAMVKELCRRFDAVVAPPQTTAENNELVNVASTTLAYIKDDTQTMMTWTEQYKELMSLDDADEIGRIISTKKWNGSSYIAEVSALHNEWKKLMDKLDKGNNEVAKRAKLLQPSEPDFSKRQMKAILELPAKLMGSTIGSEAMGEFENKTYQAHFTGNGNNGFQNLLRLLEEWNNKDKGPAPKPARADLEAILAALTAAVTKQPALLEDLVSRENVQHTLVEYTSGNYSTDSGLLNASDEEKRELGDHGVALLYAMRKQLVVAASDTTKTTVVLLKLLLLLSRGHRSQARTLANHQHLTARAAQDALIEEYAIPRLAAKLSSNGTVADDVVKMIELLDSLAENNEWARRWMLELKLGETVVHTPATSMGVTPSWNATENKDNKAARRKFLPSLIAKLASPSEADNFAPDREAAIRATDERGLKLVINFVVLAADHQATEPIHALWVLTRHGANRDEFLSLRHGHTDNTKTIPTIVNYLGKRSVSPNADTKVSIAKMFEVLITLIETPGVEVQAQVIQEIKNVPRYVHLSHRLDYPSWNLPNPSHPPGFLEALTKLRQLLA